MASTPSVPVLSWAGLAKDDSTSRRRADCFVWHRQANQRVALRLDVARQGHNAERNLFRWAKCLFGNQLQVYSLWMDLDTAVDNQRMVTEVPALPPWEIMYSLHAAPMDDV